MLLGGSAALGVGPGRSGRSLAAAAQPTTRPAPIGGSVRSAVRFLQGVTDAYRSTGCRLAQSYYDDSGLTDIGFVYDNALAIIALLAGGDVGRARAIGDALVYAQNNDEEYTDGRLRQAYHANDFAIDRRQRALRLRVRTRRHGGRRHVLGGDRAWPSWLAAPRQSSYRTGGACGSRTWIQDETCHRHRTGWLRLRRDRRPGGLQVGRAQHRRVRLLPA